MSDVTLGGVAVTHARVHLPRWGRWWADLDTVDDTDLTGPQTLELPGATLTGYVYGAPFEGRGRYRMVAGAGQWAKVVPAKAFTNDNGVLLATVLNDLASAVGETLDDVPTTAIGPHYTRRAGAAYATLNELAPRNWYVDLTGVTRIGTWPIVSYTGGAVTLDVDEARALVRLTTDDVAGLVPGVSVGGVGPASDVEIEVEPKRITVSVFGSAKLTRRLQAFAELLDALDWRRRYRGTFEFRVEAQNGNRLDVSPLRASTGLPALAGVRMRHGIPGATVVVPVGTLVLVSFVDADPARPVVVGFDDPDSTGHEPTSIKIELTDGTGIDITAGLVKIGDIDGSLDFVALAGLCNAEHDAINAELDRIEEKYNAHTHNAQVIIAGGSSAGTYPVAPGGGVTGTTATSYANLYTPSDVDAANVKAT